MKTIKTTFFICAAVLLIPMISLTETVTEKNRASWTRQLNEMNYLIMRTSAINIIHGLTLNRRQVMSLMKMSKQIEGYSPAIPDMTGDADSKLVEVKKFFQQIIGYLAGRKPVPDKIRKKVLMLRLQETEIIKKSVLGSQKAGYKGTGCLACHAPPRYFPEGNAARMRTKKISPRERKRIDKAHVTALFGSRGIRELWGMKERVDAVLSSGQKHLMKDFQCCLLPPENLVNPTRIGQAFVTDKWINYFKDIRIHSREIWKEYRHLYIVPLADLVEATLPGIQGKDKKRILKNLENLLEEARAMDDVDFELKKEALCIRLHDQLNVQSFIRESGDKKEIRQFREAMFLLLPGNISIYREVLKRLDAEK